jgi:hypothetical protein
MATYEFQCASPVCVGYSTAPTKDEAIAQMTTHVKVKHRIPSPTRPILQFLVDNTIREIPRRKGRS